MNFFFLLEEKKWHKAYSNAIPKSHVRRFLSSYVNGSGSAKQIARQDSSHHMFN